MHAATPGYLEDLAHPDLDEDTGTMLSALALDFILELSVLDGAPAADIAATARTMLALASTASFDKPSDKPTGAVRDTRSSDGKGAPSARAADRVTGGGVRKLGVPVKAVYPPVFAHSPGLDDPSLSPVSDGGETVHPFR